MVKFLRSGRFLVDLDRGKNINPVPLPKEGQLRIQMHKARDIQSPMGMFSKDEF